MPPDKLAIDAHGTASTLDGRVVDAAWTGRLVTLVWNGQLAWGVVPEPIPAAELAGDLDLVTVAELRKGSVDVGLRVFLNGTDETLDSMSFDTLSTWGPGELASSGSSTLGGTPRP